MMKPISITVLLLIGFFIVFGVADDDSLGPKQAEKTETNIVWPWGTEKYVVKKGETFVSIAKECCVPVSFLKKLNNLENPDSIKKGDSIEIPSLNLDFLNHVFQNAEWSFDSCFNDEDNHLKADWNKPVGSLGLLPSMVDEANKLAGYLKFGYDSRKDHWESEKIFKILMSYPTKVQTLREAVERWKRWKPNANADKYISHIRNSRFTINRKNVTYSIYYGNNEDDFKLEIIEKKGKKEK